MGISVRSQVQELKVVHASLLEASSLLFQEGGGERPSSIVDDTVQIVLEGVQLPDLPGKSEPVQNHSRLPSHPLVPSSGLAQVPTGWRVPFTPRKGGDVYRLWNSLELSTGAISWGIFQKFK